MKIIKNDLLGKGVKIPLKLFFLGLILLTFKITEAQFTVVATGQATTTTSVLPITVNSLYFGKGTSTGTNNLVIGSPTSLSASGSNAGASIAIGVSSLTNLTSGSENFAVGIGAMQLFASGSYNNAFGSGALRGGVGLSNISGNCAFGIYTMENAGNNSSNNSAFGNQALKQIGSGKFNVALGNTAGFYLSGDSNTVAGFGSGYFITGNRNVTLGASAGAANLTSGSANVVIGSGANIPTATASNQLSIQNIIYGFNNSGIGTTVSTGTIGIGIVPVITPASGTYPNSIAKLHVGGTLRIGTVSTGISTGEYLFVDVNGMVSKAVLPAAVGSISSTCSSQYYIPKVNAAGSPNLTCSQIYDNGTNIGIGVVPSGTLAKFEVGGTIKINTVNTIINPTNTYLWRGVDGIINQSAITDIDAFWSLMEMQTLFQA